MQNKVREHRVSKNLTQEKLAELLGVSRYTIIQIESGKQEPSGSLIIKFGNLFGKDPREIFFEDAVVYEQLATDEQAASTA